MEVKAHTDPCFTVIYGCLIANLWSEGTLKLVASEVRRLYLGRPSCVDVPGGSRKSRARQEFAKLVHQPRSVITLNSQQRHMSCVSEYLAELRFYRSGKHY
jgi:hypothetical protein